MANTRNTDPLLWNGPIVYPQNGFPTQEFLRAFNAQRELNDGLGDVIKLLDVNLIAGTGLSGGGSLGDLNDITFNLADTTVTPGTYGDGTHYAILTIDAQGRITAASNELVPAGYTDEQAQDAVGSILTDTATIDFTYDDAGNKITADLKNTAVAPATYGDGTHYPVLTIDAQGRVTAASNQTVVGGVSSVFGRTGAVVAVTGDYTPAQVGAVNKTGDTMSGALIDTVGIKAGAGTTQALASNLQFIVEGAASAAVNALFASSNGNCQLQTRRCSPDGLAASFFVVKGRGSLASPGQVLATDTVGSFTFGAYDNTAVVRATAALTCVAVSTTTSTSAEGALVLSATPLGAVSVSEVARVTVASGLQMYGTNIVVDANRSIQLRNYATGSLPATPATDGLVVYDSDRNQVVASDSGAWHVVGTYDFALFFGGKQTNAELLYRHKAVRAYTLPSSLTGSQISANTAATASTTWTLNKNGSSIGTLVWAIAGTTPTVTFSSSVSFAIGDILTIVNQATADATLADVSVDLIASL